MSSHCEETAVTNAKEGIHESKRPCECQISLNSILKNHDTDNDGKQINWKPRGKKGHIHEHKAYPIQNGGGGEEGKTYPLQDEKAKHKRNKKIQRRTERSSCIPG